jgi:hypothetical protein
MTTRELGSNRKKKSLIEPHVCDITNIMSHGKSSDAITVILGD